MFDLFDGLPVHALVVHAVVVLAPLTAVLAVVYALVPSRRTGLAWPVGLLAVATGLSGWVAGQSGERLEQRLTGGARPSAALHEHVQAGDLLRTACVVYAVVVLLAVCLALPRHRAPGRPVRGPVAVVTAVVLVLASVAVTYQTVVTGHTGAKAVWGARVGG